MTFRILADMHTHTIASGHAFSTILENIYCAQDQNMEYFAVTDHFFYPKERIDRLNELARLKHTHTINNSLTTEPRIIAGVESNLSQRLSSKDAIKINQSIKWRLVGIHDWFLDPDITHIDSLPNIFLDTIADSKIQTLPNSLCIQPTFIQPTAFAHIERGIEAFVGGEDESKVEATLRKIVDIAVDNNIMLEINEHSLHMGKATINRMIRWVKYAKQRNAKFCFGTDAHFCEEVGNFVETYRFIEAIDLDANYILNYDKEALKELI